MQRQLLSIQNDQYFWAWKAGYFVTKRVRFYASRDIGGNAETTNLITPEKSFFYNGPSKVSSLRGLTAQGAIRPHDGRETLPCLLDYGYRLGVDDLATLIRRSKFAYVSDKTDEVMGKIVVLKAADPKQRVSDLEIAVDRGPMVVFVKGTRLPNSTAVSEYRVIDAVKVAGFWLPTHGNDTLYLADGTPGRKDDMLFSQLSVNQVTDDVFSIEFPPNTRVEDKFAGKAYWVTEAPAYMWPVLISFSVLAIVAIAVVLVRTRTFGHQNRRPSQTN